MKSLRLRQYKTNRELYTCVIVALNAADNPVLSVESERSIWNSKSGFIYLLSETCDSEHCVGCFGNMCTFIYCVLVICVLVFNL
jgi:hypothetical protein